MNQEAKDKITRARIKLIMQQPFFGTLALRLRIEEDSTLEPPTAATDGKTLYYHPQWVLDNDLEIVCSMVGHEVGHCVLDHIGRRNGRDHKRWNHAGDYVINQMLKDSGFTIGDGWLQNACFANMSTDAVYNALPPDPLGSAFDDVRDDPADDTDPQLTRDEWEIAAVQAASAAASVGNLPNSIKRFIKQITEPKADWRAVMSRFVTEKSRDDYSYTRLNPKFASLGIFLPGLYSERMGEIDAVIDTSGSISEPILNAFGAELSEIKNQMRPSMLRVIYCDAAVNHVDAFEEHDEPAYVAHGGGGTDFRPPFDLIEREKYEPKCMVYLTDGYGPFPAEPAPFPVLWLMTTDVIPPWGEVIRIEV